MYKIFILFTSALLLLYPVAVYFSLQHFEPRHIGLLLLLVLFIRFMLLLKSVKLEQLKPLVGLTLSGVFIGILIIVFNEPLYLRFNPVVINLTLLLMFSYTLFSPPSMIERFARIQTPDLPEDAIIYTKTVTIVWCIFFIFNILVSTYTALYSSIEIWTLYNGLIAYILMGSLFGIEYIIRIRKISNS